MSEQQNKQSNKADKKDKIDPTLLIAAKIMKELERVHQRIPKF